VLFDRRDGTTHFLSAFGVAILEVLAAGECDTNDLLARLESRFDVALEDEERRQINVMLNQLNAMGLVTCRSD